MKLKHIIIFIILGFSAASPWTVENDFSILGLLSIISISGLMVLIGVNGIVHWNTSLRVIFLEIIKSFK